MTWTFNELTVDLDFRFYIIFYGVLIVHEFGHIFAAKMCGLKITLVEFGGGKELWSYRKLRINKWFIIPKGAVRTEKRNDFWKNLFLYLGGNIIVLLLFVILNLLFSKNDSQLTAQLNLAIFYNMLFSLIPINYFDGNGSDGLKVYKLIRNQLQAAKSV